MQENLDNVSPLVEGPSMVVNKEGPAGASKGSGMNYEITSTNDGTEDLTNWSIEDVLPTEVDIWRMNFTNGSSPSYNISIRTSDDPGVDKQIVTGATSPIVNLDFTFYTPPGARVLSFKVTAPTFTPGVDPNFIYVTGLINPTATVGQNITNTVTNTATSTMGLITRTDSATTNIFNALNGIIGEFVWNDLNGDGIYDVGVEPGINGVTVELYDSTGTTLLKSVTTANQYIYPGYYVFSDVAAGTYVVKFIPPAGYTLTTQNLAFNGSTPDPTTGFTNTFTIGPNASNLYINAGLLVTNQGEIGDFVWNDLNANGIHDLGEPGVNGVTVELYDSTKTNLLATTLTANNNANQPGYYSFKNLVAGTYYVKFIAPAGYTLTIQNLGPNGSTPDPTTGFTNAILLTNNEVINTIDAGLLAPCDPPVIHTTIYCAPLNSVYNPLTGVTATDCQGNNITADVIVTQNTVNTAVVGTYSVTYQVTDLRGQTTIKSINVVVCKPTPLEQAVTDIIESVALEQTALSHIINAEGEKIQKILGIGANIEEIRRINTSVEDTINAIAILEMVLEQKLELFQLTINADGCCSTNN